MKTNPSKKPKIIFTNNLDETWNGVNKYRNVEFVKKALVELHNVPKSQTSNVLKQAEQIRHCLTQAKEYHEASKSVSLSTKPLLLYYSCMSLALAEVLFRQDGRSSLEKARASNRHHGLLFAENINNKMPIVEFLENIRARPMINQVGERSGTFELWRRSAVYESCVVERKITYPDTQSSILSYFCPFRGENIALFPENGLSLLDCLLHFPGIAQQLGELGILTKTLRASIKYDLVSSEDGAHPANKMQIIVHPHSEIALSDTFKSFKIHPSYHNIITVKELTQGGMIFEMSGERLVSANFTLPETMQTSSDEIFFVPEFPLNEFGTIYTSLFMLSNLVRYFPDKWINEVEKSTDFCVLIESFINSAEMRYPLLCLSELSSRTYVTKNSVH